MWEALRHNDDGTAQYDSPELADTLEDAISEICWRVGAEYLRLDVFNPARRRLFVYADECETDIRFSADGMPSNALGMIAVIGDDAWDKCRAALQL